MAKVRLFEKRGLPLTYFSPMSKWNSSLLRGMEIGHNVNMVLYAINAIELAVFIFYNTINVFI